MVCRPTPGGGGGEVLIYQAFLEGLDDGFGFGVDVKLPVNVVDVEADSSHTDKTGIRNHLIAITPDQTFENIHLPG